MKEETNKDIKEIEEIREQRTKEFYELLRADREISPGTCEPLEHRFYKWHRAKLRKVLERMERELPARMDDLDMYDEMIPGVKVALEYLKAIIKQDDN